MISPTLDPSGSGIVHRASPLSKATWLVAVTAAGTVSTSLPVEALLAAQALVVFMCVSRGKITDTPPVLQIILVAALLLFSLDLLFSGSAIGNWQASIHSSQLQDRFSRGLTDSLRLIATASAFFAFTLSTVPRDFARTLESLRVSILLTEPLALSLRFLPVLEIDTRMLLRVASIRFARQRSRAGFSQRLKIARLFLVSLLIVVLSQAKTTGESLQLKGFGNAVRRGHYLVSRRSVGDLLLFALSLSSLMLSFLWS